MAASRAKKNAGSPRLLTEGSGGAPGAVEVRRGGGGLSSAIRRDKTAFRSLGTLGYALHKIPGGRKTFIEYARLAADSNEQVSCFVSCWDSLSQREQVSIPLDQVCIESGAITPSELLGEVVKSAFQFGQDVSSLMAATCLPDVVDASIKFAKRESGIKDRIALMQHANFVPIPQKSGIPSIINKVYAVAQAKAEGGNSASSSGGMPTFEDDSIEMSKIVRSSDEGESENGSR
jgi:hypothetical protein